MFCLGKILRGLGAMVVLAGCCAWGQSSATLLLEEPYGKLGFFTATGHAAVYLSGVCAETPLMLRTCAPGELGAVISRYDGVGSYDWVAIPLIPYLYAVEQPDDVPLFADAKMVNSPIRVFPNVPSIPIRSPRSRFCATAQPVSPTCF